MKAKIVLLAILSSVVLLGACVGTNALGILDESIPESSQCQLEIRNSLSVILYDDKPVNWAPKLGQNKVTITLPPGPHTFTATYTTTQNVGGATQFITNTSKLSAEFIPGRNYRIVKQNIWLIFFTITNVKIKEVK